MPAFLPDDYVPDAGQRLDFYRRLAQARDEDDVRATLAELEDRYGPLPEEALLLGEVMIDKTLVRALGALGYELGPARLVLSLRSDTRARSRQGAEAGAGQGEPLQADARHAPLVHLRRGREARSDGGGAGPVDAARGADRRLTAGRSRFSGRLSRMYILLHLAVLTVTVLALARIFPSVQGQERRVGDRGGARLLGAQRSSWAGSSASSLIVPAILTLGLLFLFLPFIVNAVLLWLTDKLMGSFEIETLGGLFASAAIITLVNWLFHIAHPRAPDAAMHRSRPDPLDLAPGACNLSRMATDASAPFS